MNVLARDMIRVVLRIRVPKKIENVFNAKTALGAGDAAPRRRSTAHDDLRAAAALLAVLIHGDVPQGEFLQVDGPAIVHVHAVKLLDGVLAVVVRVEFERLN